MMIKLTEEQVFVYGHPNFACSAIAKLLIESGLYEAGPAKAEYEQAVFIHWASELLRVHGENWRAVGHEILKQSASKLQLKGEPCQSPT